MRSASSSNTASSDCGAVPRTASTTSGSSSTPCDGWIQGITIDWGDGSPKLTLANADTCQIYAGYASGVAFMPSSQLHAYATPGPPTATVATTSSACDGTNPQTVTQSTTTQS
jgi:hypothetical protein